VNITQTVFKKNSGAAEGNAIWGMDIKALIIQSRFESNGENASTGGQSTIAVHGTSWLILDGSSFVGNVAPRGVVSMTTEGTDHKVNECSFSKNVGTAVVLTPFMANQPALLLVNSSTFEHNTGQSPTLPSGGVYATNSLAIVMDSLFVGNTAHGDGGAITVDGSALQVIRTRFFDNTALRGSGGAISATASTVDLRECEFRRNHAAESGGAVRIERQPPNAPVPFDFPQVRGDLIGLDIC